MAATTKVAIIGGGISGLSCAQELSKDPTFDVTVYDTGRLRPGGRCSSRQPNDLPKEEDPQYPLLSRFLYDHAAQLIAPSSQFPPFSQQMDQWLAQGILKPFPENSVCQILKDGKLQSLSQSQPQSKAQSFFHATNGMGSLATNIKGQFQLEQDVWVSPSSGVQFQKNTGKWKLQAKGKTLGYYDQLIIAHNGKCADRIMSKTPASDLHQLLRVNFAPTVPAYGGNKMTLNSLYSLTIVLPNDSTLSRALPEPFICGFSTHPQLRMISCQTRKYSTSETYEVWNILSSAKFAKTYKAPQEFLPPETVEEVTQRLLQAVQDSVHISTTRPLQPLESRLQLWGAAVPLNSWSQTFLWDKQYQVGVCGDWLVEPSIAGAWTSGNNLAKHLKQKDSSTFGLEGQFQRSESASRLGLAALPSLTDANTSTKTMPVS